MPLPEYLRRDARSKANTKLTALRTRGQVSSSPSPVSSQSSLASPTRRKPRSSATVGKPKREVVGNNKRRVDNGRKKDGCLSCRIRRKRCSGPTEDDHSSCMDCQRLGVDCLGFSEKRPEWLRQPGALELEKAKIAAAIANQKKLEGPRPRSKKEMQEDIKPKLSPHTPPRLLPAPSPIAINDDQLDTDSDDSGSAHELDFADEDDEYPATPACSRGFEGASSPVDEPLPDIADAKMPESTMPVLVQDDDTSPSPELVFRGMEGQPLPPEFLAACSPFNGWNMQNGLLESNSLLHQASMPSFDPAMQYSNMGGVTDLSSYGGLVPFDDTFSPEPFDAEISTAASSPLALVEEQLRTQPLISPMYETVPFLVPPPMYQHLMLSNPASPAYTDYVDFNPAPIPAPDIPPATPVEPWTSWHEGEIRVYEHYLNNVLPLQHVLQRPETKREVILALARQYPLNAPPALLCLGLAHQLHELTRTGVAAPDLIHSTYVNRNDCWKIAKNELISDKVLNVKRAAIAVLLYHCSVFTACQPNIDYFRYVSILQAFFRQVNPGGKIRDLLALMGQDRLMDYVVKSAFWMDVTCAISKKSQPRFMDYYWQLATLSHSGTVLLDMSEMVGCDTDTMIALAEIASLEAYKLSHPNMSMHELLDGQRRISQRFLHDGQWVHTGGTILLPHPANEHHSAYSAGVPSTPVAHAFRCAARAYLAAVVRGWRPLDESVRMEVHATIAALHNIKSSKEHPVDRAIALPLFIVGMLTDHPMEKQFIHQRFMNIDIPECSTFYKLVEVLQHVWRCREILPGQEVSFLQIMLEINDRPVLIA